MEHERIPTDDPIRHIWNRLDLLSSFSGAETFLRRQAIKQGFTLSEDLFLKKAQGLAFSIRSANEYFKLPIEGNLTRLSRFALPPKLFLLCVLHKCL